MIEIINNRWYSGGTGSVGFVLIQDIITNKYMCYTGCSTKGYTEEQDVENIKNYGAKVNFDVAQALFSTIDISNYKGY